MKTTKSEPQKQPLSGADELMKLGFSVIPVSRETKKPLVGSWKPYQERRVEPDELTGWIERYSAGNIAVVTGRISGIVVLDIDDEDASNPVITRHGGLPDSPEVQTARGRHIYFKHPGVRCSNSAHKIAPGMDFRGDGGYVVAPPSVHESGVPYVWSKHPDQIPFAELPDWLREEVCEVQRDPKKQIVFPPTLADSTTSYGAVALRREADAVRNAKHGERNDRLNKAAFSCGQLVGGHELSRTEVEYELMEASVSAGLTETEARATLLSAIDAGMRHPRGAPSRTDSMKRNDPRGHRGTFPLTDAGLGERFAHQHDGIVLFNHTTGHWMLWDGSRWVEEKDGRVMELAKLTARTIVDEVQSLSPDAVGPRNELLRFAAKAESRQRIEAMLKLAASEQQIRIEQERLDQGLKLLNLSNGTYDLESDKFREHRATDYITKLSPVQFDAGARCPQWLSFLNRIFNEDGDLIAFVQRALGYSLTASAKEQCLFLCHGMGANGKSTLLNTVHHILGDYAVQAQFDSLLVKRSEGPRNDIAALVGARFVAASEAERGQRLAESLIKQLTGGDPVTVRRLYSEPFTFRPGFKLWLSTNHKPRISGTDHGIWRRVHLLPFNVTIPDEEKDRELGEKLIAEGSGILNWMLVGYQSWRESGLTPPPVVMSATTEYRDEQDSLGAFFKERCDDSADGREKLSDLYTAYKSWAEDGNERVLPKRHFAQIVVERGYEKKALHGNVMHVLGLKTLPACG